MFRKDFPFFNECKGVYLDSAATTQKPKSVIDAQVEYYKNFCANTHRSNFSAANKATIEFEKTRELLRDFIGANTKEQIIFTKGITESINFIASSFKVQNVIISSLEHHANIVPWHITGKKLGENLFVIGCDEELNFDFNEFEKVLETRPHSLVSIAHITNAFGKIHDIEKIAKIAKKYSCFVMIDGAQSLLHAPIQVEALDVDFFAISSHKTLGPTGVGAIYVKKEHLEKLKPYQGGGGSIKDVEFSRTLFYDAPYRYEAGTQNIAGVIGFGEAIRYINGVGLENIIAKNEKIYSYLHEKIREIDGVILYVKNENCGGSLSFNVEGASCDDVGTLLSKLDIFVRSGHHCAQPLMKKLGLKGTVRASVSFYNTNEDVDRFIVALKKVIGILRG